MPPINTRNAITEYNKVTVTDAATDLVAENGRRVGLFIYNATGADLYVRIDGDASTTDYTFVLSNGGLYEAPANCFTDKVTGVLSTGTGSVMVTEIRDN